MTESAMEHLEYLFGYLKGTKDYHGLRAPLNRPDVDLFAAAAKKPSAHPDLNLGGNFIVIPTLLATQMNQQ